ncbi:hypothetical protein H310_10729 [Aphanomyces invadans]|uniref:Uncharacterized protein n=1 Tax=Aphanomyces invadans TaxID=157072 RepID=A0A024TPY5_9STRA|nr:hypothetical protein H310_10729 [Aphanomyces invadans]ETV96088.1 hypothetical protein H310_10729 [Aphanomyces invadans]|eukprot:XP_008875399.1 hypothetical protein H310_10729 [Aphanomyces invadans]
MPIAACALGQALVDVLAEMEAEGAPLTHDERLATVQLMEDILFSHMQDASEDSEADGLTSEDVLPRRHVATRSGVFIAASVHEYSSYMETWRLHMVDTAIKMDGEVLNPDCPDLDATLRRIQRRKKTKKAKRKTDDQEH